MDFEAVGAAAVADFDRRIAEIRPDLCVSFNAEARSLTDRLLVIYQFAAICARNEQDLDEVAKGWKFMVEMCDHAAGSLSRLRKEHPDCGAGFYHDQILDLRNKCRRLQEMHS